MARIKYVPKKFSNDSLRTIERARLICEEYAAQGYDLTLRQLYYQFVSRDWIPNKDTEYKRLGSIINDARLAGLLDWDYIVDRTRNLRENGHWDSPAELVEAAAQQFQFDKWADQDTRVEVWIEKDALVGVLESCCPGEDVPFFSCRGYTSQSELWSAGQRIGRHLWDDHNVVILHLGDHDPSGIDMTRDIRDRLQTFLLTDWVKHTVDTRGQEILDDDDWRADADNHYKAEVWDRFRVQRIALTMDQIDQYGPPPNPAKLTDARARGYVEQYGYSSWELDALEPRTLVDLIRDSIAEHRDADLWKDALRREAAQREVLATVSERWDDVQAFLNRSA